jgi:hypothetical protein
LNSVLRACRRPDKRSRRGARAALGVVLAVGAAALVALLHAPTGSSERSRPTVKHFSRSASPSLCRAPIGPYSYNWPMKPFDRQHPTRSNFGDPRTVSWTAPLGADGPGSAGDFSFHNGIDIEASAGTPVYPVVSGIVHHVQPNAVVVRTRDDRKFLYWHIVPLVHLGERVLADRTVLGHVMPVFDHLHFGEVDGYRIHNPADPGHLTPYVDRTTPVVSRLEFDSPGDLHVLDPTDLKGVVSIVAQAEDPPPLPIPGPWDDRPVTPALLSWRLDTETGLPVIPEHAVVDFRQTEPAKRFFWTVYAEGTYQNFPDFAHHYYWGHTGQYLFNLTPQGLDTRTLPNGRYLLTVDAADVCGNQGSLTQEIDIRN